jgi:hypothetical protein
VTKQFAQPGDGVGRDLGHDPWLDFAATLISSLRSRACRAKSWGESHIPSDANVEKDEEEEVPAPPAAPPPAPGAAGLGRYAQLNASWKQLSQQAAQKIAADPSQREALTKAMAGITEILQSC